MQHEAKLSIIFKLVLLEVSGSVLLEGGGERDGRHNGHAEKTIFLKSSFNIFSGKRY
jgi:hypothetical protein